MSKAYILAIDQGTSSTKSLVFDENGKVASRGSVPLQTRYFGDGFVEQDPEAIYRNVLDSVSLCLKNLAENGGDPAHIRTCGISNQRETFVLWDKTGTPLHNAIVWQCKRSIQVCERLKAEGLEAKIRERTGLFIDPYFSGTKLIWLTEQDETIREAVRSGNAFFGTVDAWLLYKLTGGASYATDYTNASRTLFFNLKSLTWDEELLRDFGLTGLHLPALKPSSADFGESTFEGLFSQPVPVQAMIGDSHSAAFGEGCFTPGTAKATLGTGCSIIMNIGQALKPSQNGMVNTICWSMEDRVEYALEGVIVTCGATIEWLKNSLGLFAESRETEALANSVSDNGGVYLIPAFSGLGAPHWQMERKASISGLTFATTKAHLVRAALESIPYQIKDVITAMEDDTGQPLAELMVNGGMTGNQFLLRFLADLLRINVVNQGQPDVSAQGAAFLAGLKNGIYTDIDQLKAILSKRDILSPDPGNDLVKKGYAGWLAAL